MTMETGNGICRYVCIPLWHPLHHALHSSAGEKREREMRATLSGCCPTAMRGGQRAGDNCNCSRRPPRCPPTTCPLSLTPLPTCSASFPSPHRARANAGGLTIFFMELLRFYALSGNSETAFTGFFQVVGAIAFTHLGVSILQQGSRTVSSGTYYQVNTSTESADEFPPCGWTQSSLYVVHAHGGEETLYFFFWGGGGGTGRVKKKLPCIILLFYLFYQDDPTNPTLSKKRV